MASAQASERVFLGVSALLFAGSAAGTILWCGSGAPISPMPIGGRGIMAMPWTPMPGESWLGAAASFLGMWVLMMVAMMLPSLVPTLRRYREVVGRAGETRLARLSVLVGLGYFVVWTAVGMVVFPIGAALAPAEAGLPLLARAGPLAAGVVVLTGGALQFTEWKARRLACCRRAGGRDRAMRACASAAWRHGLSLGLDCCYCCGPLTAILLVIGVMDVRAMAAVAAAITLERLAPGGECVAQATGAVIVAAGTFLIVRAVGLGF